MAGGRVALFLLALSGMLAWAAQFTAIYTVTSTLCERGWADAALFGIGVVPLIVSGVTLIALTAVGWVLWLSLGWSRQMDRETLAVARFLNDTTMLVSALSLVAILWQGLPGLLVPPCY